MPPPSPYFPPQVQMMLAQMMGGGAPPQPGPGMMAPPGAAVPQQAPGGVPPEMMLGGMPGGGAAPNPLLAALGAGQGLPLPSAGMDPQLVVMLLQQLMDANGGINRGGVPPYPASQGAPTFGGLGGMPNTTLGGFGPSDLGSY
jgi:hypothetical protein